MRIIFLLVLVVFGTATVFGNPKPTVNKKAIAPAKATATKPTAQTALKVKAPTTKPTTQTTPTKTVTKPTTQTAVTTPAKTATTTQSPAPTPKAPSAATLAITSHVTTDFINRLPIGAKLPASTPPLKFKLTLNGKQTPVLAKQDLKEVLTALLALAPSAPATAQTGILTALNYGRLFLNPTGTPGSATTIESAVAAFQIAQYIGIKK